MLVLAALGGDTRPAEADHHPLDHVRVRDRSQLVGQPLHAVGVPGAERDQEPGEREGPRPAAPPASPVQADGLVGDLDRCPELAVEGVRRGEQAESTKAMRFLRPGVVGGDPRRDRRLGQQPVRQAHLGHHGVAQRHRGRVCGDRVPREQRLRMPLDHLEGLERPARPNQRPCQGRDEGGGRAGHRLPSVDGENRVHGPPRGPRPLGQPGRENQPGRLGQPTGRVHRPTAPRARGHTVLRVRVSTPHARDAVRIFAAHATTCPSRIPGGSKFRSSGRSRRWSPRADAGQTSAPSRSQASPRARTPRVTSRLSVSPT